ncbi:MAG TPA: amidohydrolase family protein [Streptosporangiaceae bacterium]|nr:amidohydrolase family protein [Streptosporangiaceae bacterium]
MNIDVHAHLAVPAADALVAGEPGFAAELAQERQCHSAESLAVNRAQLERVTPAMTDAGQRLADMDAMSVDIQVVEPMPMHHYWAGSELAARYTRTVNEAVTAHCALAPDRLAGLGTVPLQHPGLAVTELEHAVGTLGLKGVCVGSQIANRELADPAHEGFWAAAAGMGAVVLIHPWGSSLGSRLAAYYLGNTVGQPAETTVALSHIIFSGLLDRHPGLKLISVHGGGYLPGYLSRGDHAWQVRPDARGCAEPPSSYLRRIWFDSLVYTPAGLRQLIDVTGADRIMLGTDYPFDMGVDDPVQRLGPLPPEDRDAITGGNATALFGLTP